MMLNFDATKFNPEQGMAKHPVGKFPAIISGVSVEENNSKTGGYFSVLFTTQAGSIRKNYNLWFNNPSDGQKQAIDIASRQLSALCHAVGIIRLGDGRELINARCQIDVTPQAKDERYNEVSKVYDANGDEPGKAPAAPQPQAAPAQPVQPQNGGWAPNGGASQTNAPATSPAASGQNWQQGPSAPASGQPPWAK